MQCLRELARGSSNVVVVDVEALVMETGAERWYDPRLWYLGRIPLSAQAHGQLASEYANFIAARWGSVRKCIVLDLDNTLWGGVIGEDGMTGIQLGHEGIGLAFVDFQRELLNLRQKGILLAICSKNNPEDAYEAIRKHPAMVLREEHFAAIEINWNDKADNIREIARRLNIGVDSLVFIDDSPVERKRVREAIQGGCRSGMAAGPMRIEAGIGPGCRRVFFKIRYQRRSIAAAEKCIIRRRSGSA
jgi:HAD superfamily phosphatase (TIGR01681 family)